jgi:hypothetical protein
MPINIKRYLQILNNLNPNIVECGYCGNEIDSYSEVAMCHFCELYTTNIITHLNEEQQHIKELIDNRNKAFIEQKWQDAFNFAKEIDISNDPAILYGNALFYWTFSDYLYHNINYGIEGYMEPNSNAREKSLIVISQSKTLIYKTINICNLQLKEGYHKDTAYLKVIAECKMSRFVNAKKTLDLINQKEDNNSPIVQYANMVYYTGIKDKSKALIYIDKLVENQLNAFYYLAKILVLDKKIDDAKRILEIVAKKAYFPRANEMLVNINDIFEKNMG